jgi:hypothetical protein
MKPQSDSTKTDRKKVNKAMPENQPLRLTEDERTNNRFLLYTTKSGVQLEVLFDGDEPWFTQADLATMYGVDVRTANEHVSNFLSAGELDPATIRKFRIVRQEGARQVEREIIHYGLDVAFYIGYRVNSDEGKLFRGWAANSLIQLAKYGFVIDKRKLQGDPDRLAKLRLIIQDLRNNEANIYAELKNQGHALDGTSYSGGEITEDHLRRPTREP